MLLFIWGKKKGVWSYILCRFGYTWREPGTKNKDVKEFKVDVFAIGDDWKGKCDFLNEYCEVVYLPRTPEISTTKIKSDLDMNEIVATE